MPPVLANVTLTTKRSRFMPANGITGVAQSAQAAISAHIGANTGNAYKMLPVAALESDYEAKVDSGTDIVEGDILDSITLPNGITPWPGLGVAINANETFRVAYIVEGTPGPLASRTLYIKRDRAGGPTY